MENTLEMWDKRPKACKCSIFLIMNQDMRFVHNNVAQPVSVMQSFRKTNQTAVHRCSFEGTNNYVSGGNMIVDICCGDIFPIDNAEIFTRFVRTNL
jgi:hypothetical protein